MNATASPAALAISPAGPVAGTAWLAPSPGGVEMHVIGKLVLQLGHAGATSFVSKPELPGWNQGRGAKEEVEVSDARKLIVRGHRTQPGKLILRRGTTAIGEIPFGPGVDTVTMPLSSTMQATIAGKGGDDWLVVEGVEGPQARRWCKLPKLGIVACWDEIERMLLTSRVCLVDVSSWTIAFVVRASRKLLPAMAPRVVTLSVLDLAQGPGAQETPSPQHASGTYVAAREPAPPAKLTPPKPIPSGAALLGGDGPPTMVSSGVELPVPKPQPSTAGTAGSKLGRTRQLQPEEVQQLLARSQDAERPIGGPMV
ncbi:MAG: hypothetical protein HOW73_18530, partial [Polyangiaceae bacterium]|nr:hypothetical protein [Polyangiaceae bacterium]